MVQLRRGQPHRLCGTLEDSTLSLSRAFGDACKMLCGGCVGLHFFACLLQLLTLPALPCCLQGRCRWA